MHQYLPLKDDETFLDFLLNRKEALLKTAYTKRSKLERAELKQLKQKKFLMSHIKEFINKQRGHNFSTQEIIVAMNFYLDGTLIDLLQDNEHLIWSIDRLAYSVFMFEHPLTRHAFDVSYTDRSYVETNVDTLLYDRESMNNFMTERNAGRSGKIKPRIGSAPIEYYS